MSSLLLSYCLSLPLERSRCLYHFHQSCIANGGEEIERRIRPHGRGLTLDWKVLLKKSKHALTGHAYMMIYGL
jgi:hypothetical protein